MPSRENHAHPVLTSDAVPARHLRDLAQKLMLQGHSVQDVLEDVGLTLEVLNHPHARIERQQVTQAVQGLVVSTGRSDLGFELGLMANMSTVDLVWPLLFASATLAEGMSLVSRYFALITPTHRMSTRRQGDDLLISCEPVAPLPYDVALIGLESTAVGMYRLILFLLQEKTASARLDLSWPAPKHAARYRELKGLRVRFGGSGVPHFTLTLSAELADAPLPMADPQSVAAAQARCSDLLAELTSNASWRDLIARLLRGVEGHFPTQAEVAGLMRISTRTMNRRLTEENTSYRVLAAAIRHERAKKLLLAGEMPLTAIAHALGYSDSANFSRAFRQVERMNPGAYRQCNRCKS